MTMLRRDYAADAADMLCELILADEMRARKAPFAATLRAKTVEIMRRENVTLGAEWSEAWALYDRISDDLSRYQSFDVPPALRADLAGLVDKLEAMTK